VLLHCDDQDASRRAEQAEQRLDDRLHRDAEEALPAPFFG
jgi:hypothetical protein